MVRVVASRAILAHAAAVVDGGRLPTVAELRVLDHVLPGLQPWELGRLLLVVADGRCRSAVFVFLLCE